MASVTRPHAVIVPYPAQGHINAMMPLVQILYSRGFYITFFNTQYVQERLLRAGSVDSLKSLPGFRFETFPDGLPPEHGRTSNIPELHRSFSDNGPLHLEKLMDKLKHSESDGVPPVTCIISDGAASFSQKIARKLGVPRVAFWAHSVCGVSAFFFAPLLVEKGYLPLKGISSSVRSSKVVRRKELKKWRAKYCCCVPRKNNNQQQSLTNMLRSLSSIASLKIKDYR